MSLESIHGHRHRLQETRKERKELNFTLAWTNIDIPVRSRPARDLVVIQTLDLFCEMVKKKSS